MKPHPKYDGRYPQSPYRFHKGPACIYILIDPRDWTVRYVGKTTDPKLRLKQHLQGAESRDPRQNWQLRAWTRDLLREGLQPQLRVVTRCSHHAWEQIERRWIAYYRTLGSVYNISAGGRYYTTEREARIDVLNQFAPQTVARIDRFGVVHRSVPSERPSRHGGKQLQERAMQFLEGKSPRIMYDYEEDRAHRRTVAATPAATPAPTPPSSTPVKRRPMIGRELHKWARAAVQEAVKKSSK